MDEMPTLKQQLKSLIGIAEEYQLYEAADYLRKVTKENNINLTKRQQADLKRKEKRDKYLKDRENVRWMYRNTSNGIETIAKHYGISPTTANHMIDGKGEPKWVQELVKEDKLEK